MQFDIAARIGGWLAFDLDELDIVLANGD